MAEVLSKMENKMESTIPDIKTINNTRINKIRIHKVSAEFSEEICIKQYTKNVDFSWFNACINHIFIYFNLFIFLQN